jgi:hypothetical protein
MFWSDFVISFQSSWFSEISTGGTHQAWCTLCGDAAAGRRLPFGFWAAGWVNGYTAGGNWGQIPLIGVCF